MKVSELIKKLQEFDPDVDIEIWDMNSFQHEIFQISMSGDDEGPGTEALVILIEDLKGGN